MAAEGEEEKVLKNSAQFSSNEDTLIADFNGELHKDATTVGSFEEDYSTVCSSFNIVPCPFLKISTDKATCKIMNCAVDLSNWRAMLIAASTVNSVVKEFVFVNCALTKQHIDDLSIALEKLGIIHALRMEFITIVQPTEEDSISIAEFWKPLLNGNIHVPYVTLKGCGIDDPCVRDIISVLSENLTIQALNLSDNAITDSGASALFSIVQLISSIKYLVVKNCQITGGESSLRSLADIFVGKLVSEEHDAIMKNVAKRVVDRNKALKDLNKKRKGKYPELNDLVAPTERIIKVGDDSLMVHRTIVSIDISHNELMVEPFEDMISYISEKVEPITVAGIAPCESKIILYGMNDTIKGVSARYEALEPELQINMKLLSVPPPPLASVEDTDNPDENAAVSEEAKD